MRLVTRCISLVLLSVALAATANPQPAAAAARGGGPVLVTSMVELPLDARSAALGINVHGTVVGWTTVHDEQYAFRWSESAGTVILDRGVAWRVNADGMIAGYDWGRSGLPAAIVWIDDQAQTVAYGEATDVNDLGQVVGWHQYPSGVYSAFSWAGTNSFQDLGTLLGFGYFAGFSQAMGITSEGLIVGWSTSASGWGPHAFRWTASGGMVDLGAPEGLSSSAMDANRHGDIVGWVGNRFEDARAVVWEKGEKLRYLPTLGGSRSMVFAVNDFGQAVGWSETAAGAFHAVVWYPGGLIDLGPGSAHDINNPGQLVGTAAVSGEFRPVVWQLARAARGRPLAARR